METKMNFNKNERQVLFLFRNYRENVRSIKRYYPDNVLKYLLSCKYRFRQDFIFRVVQKGVKIENENVNNEIKRWGKIYNEIRKQDDDKVIRNDNVNKERDFLTYRNHKHLTYDIAQQIRKEAKDGMRNQDLSNKYGVSCGNVSSIVHNRIWTNPNNIKGVRTNGKGRK